jgi:hypothetical protein
LAGRYDECRGRRGESEDPDDDAADPDDDDDADDDTAAFFRDAALRRGGALLRPRRAAKSYGVDSLAPASCRMSCRIDSSIWYCVLGL